MNKNRDIVLTVIVIALIGWLVVRHFMGENTTQAMPTPHATERTIKK